MRSCAECIVVQPRPEFEPGSNVVARAVSGIGQLFSGLGQKPKQGDGQQQDQQEQQLQQWRTNQMLGIQPVFVNASGWLLTAETLGSPVGTTELQMLISALARVHEAFADVVLPPQVNAAFLAAINRMLQHQDTSDAKLDPELPHWIRLSRRSTSALASMCAASAATMLKAEKGAAGRVMQDGSEASVDTVANFAGVVMPVQLCLAALLTMMACGDVPEQAWQQAMRIIAPPGEKGAAEEREASSDMGSSTGSGVGGGAGSSPGSSEENANIHFFTPDDYATGASLVGMLAMLAEGQMEWAFVWLQRWDEGLQRASDTTDITSLSPGQLLLNALKRNGPAASAMLAAVRDERWATALVHHAQATPNFPPFTPEACSAAAKTFLGRATAGGGSPAPEAGWKPGERAAVGALFHTLQRSAGTPVASLVAELSPNARYRLAMYCARCSGSKAFMRQGKDTMQLAFELDPCKQVCVTMLAAQPNGQLLQPMLLRRIAGQAVQEKWSGAISRSVLQALQQMKQMDVDQVLQDQGARDIALLLLQCKGSAAGAPLTLLLEFLQTVPKAASVLTEQEWARVVSTALDAVDCTAEGGFKQLSQLVQASLEVAWARGGVVAGAAHACWVSQEVGCFTKSMEQL